MQTLEEVCFVALRCPLIFEEGESRLLASTRLTVGVDSYKWVAPYLVQLRPSDRRLMSADFQPDFLQDLGTQLRERGYGRIERSRISRILAGMAYSVAVERVLNMVMQPGSEVEDGSGRGHLIQLCDYQAWR